MSEPVRKAYSREEMLEEATVWMCSTFGSPSTLKGDHREQWYIRLGIMTNFITDMFPNAKGES